MISCCPRDSQQSILKEIKPEYSLEGRMLKLQYFGHMMRRTDSLGTNLPANAGDVGLTPGLGKSPGEGNGKPLQYFCLGNPKDREAWQATIHGVTKESDRT